MNILDATVSQVDFASEQEPPTHMNALLIKFVAKRQVANDEGDGDDEAEWACNQTTDQVELEELWVWPLKRKEFLLFHSNIDKQKDRP